MDQINGTPYFRDSEKKFDQDLYQKKNTHKTTTKTQERKRKMRQKLLMVAIIPIVLRF